MSIYCSICEDSYTEKQYNKHITSNEHEKTRIDKGFYNFTCCPYCRLHTYILQLPHHVINSHPEKAEEWGDIKGLDFLNQLMTITNKLNNIKKMKEEPQQEEPQPDVKTPSKDLIKLYEGEGGTIHINKHNIDEHNELINTIHNTSTEEQPKPIRRRRGKYKFMTDDEINEHKLKLTKERQRRFYEKHRTRYKKINSANYDKRQKTTGRKKQGRPPIYKD